MHVDPKDGPAAITDHTLVELARRRGGYITVPALERELGISAIRSQELIEQMVNEGLLGVRQPGGYPLLKKELPSSVCSGTSTEITAESKSSVPESVGTAEGAVSPVPGAACGAANTNSDATPTLVTRLGIGVSSGGPTERPCVGPVPVDQLDVLDSLRVRFREDETTVTHYAELWRSGVTFKPILVGELDGKKYIAGGVHRWRAAILAGKKDILAEVHKVDLRTMFLMALQDNAEHGLPPSHEERQTNVDRMLTDAEWGTWANSQIASHCGVSDQTVRRRREALDLDKPEDLKRKQIRRGKVVEAKVRKRRRGASGNGNVTVDAQAATPPGEVRESSHGTAIDQGGTTATDDSLFFSALNAVLDQAPPDGSIAPTLITVAGRERVRNAVDKLRRLADALETALGSPETVTAANESYDRPAPAESETN